MPDHLLILREKQLQCVLNRYVISFDRARPHQGIRQHLPEPPASPALSPHPSDTIIGIPILGGFHHDYQRAA
jgi:putative transposase